MRVVIVASGEPDATDTRWLDAADLVIAADGGATWLERIGRRPDLLVGDLDSISEAAVARLTADGTEVERHPADKDASDTELALDAALRRGATEVILLGALGGSRLDHELANLLLLAAPELQGAARVRIVRGSTRALVLAGPDRLVLGGSPGDRVSLLPLAGEVVGVSTVGLRWPLATATLRAGRTRGLSNEIVEARASVSIDRGSLLVVESSAEEPHA
jgi:thiamine pyrophosphokinase